MRSRDERGQVTVLIVGFALVLVMAVVVVTDASAAYLQRQGLDSLADGAALYAADLGATGSYADGLSDERLLQEEESVKGAVATYLALTGAAERFPGIRVRVDVDPVARSVTVALDAPLDLPLTVPGSPSAPRVGASSTAAVTVVQE